MAITYRSLKGSPLLDSEVDGNFADLVGRVEGWNDLVESVVVRNGAPAAPTIGIFRDNIYCWQFAPGAVNECFANFHLGHDYVPGTMVYPHVHWSPHTTSVGTVRWAFEYTWARRADSTGQITFPATQTLFIDVTLDTSHQYHHMVNESIQNNGIPGSTMEVDSIIMCRVYRDGASVVDNFPDALNLLSVDMHYQSNTKSTPLRVPPFF